MFLSALDISFSNTGIAHIDIENKTITLSSLPGDKAPHKKFNEIQKSIHEYTLPQLCVHLAKTTFLVYEEPFPFGSFSSGLYALDTAIIQKFYHIPHFSYHPRTLEQIHKTNSHTKNQSKNLAFLLIQLFIWEGYEIIYPDKKKIPHDTCEALIYACLYLSQNNCFSNPLHQNLLTLLDTSKPEKKKKKKKKTEKEVPPSAS